MTATADSIPAITLDLIRALCAQQTNTQNGYRVSAMGFYWELDEAAHADGRITGQTFQRRGILPARPAGTFTIYPDGSIEAPNHLLRALFPQVDA